MRKQPAVSHLRPAEHVLLRSRVSFWPRIFIIIDYNMNIKELHCKLRLHGLDYGRHVARRRRFVVVFRRRRAYVLAFHAVLTIKNPCMPRLRRMRAGSQSLAIQPRRHDNSLFSEAALSFIRFEYIHSFRV